MDGAVGFWSYVQADDAGDHGRILALAEDLRANYRLQTAEEFELFVDRESIQWGEEWEARISDAIAGTTFFIPIITPSYFQSNPCRQELLKFVRDATRIGLLQLVMPVYWITVREFDRLPEEVNDEAISAIAEHQWQDLREVRLEDRGAASYRQAVHRLAAELAKRAATVAQTDDVPQRAASQPSNHTPEESDQEPGILDHMAGSEEKMNQLAEIMQEIGDAVTEIGALVEEANQQMGSASERGQGTRAALAITEKLAGDLKTPAGKIEGLGHQYASTLATLDPAIHAHFDLIELQDERDQDQEEFLEVVGEMSKNADEALDQLQDLVEAAKFIAKFSRSLRAPLRQMRAGLQGVLDGRAIIADWGARAAELQAT